jgi:integrase
MSKTLTAKTVETAKPTASRQEVADAACPGLYLTIQPTGAKGWAFRYRFGGKPSKLVLGTFPAMTLAKARQAASEARDKVDAGNDPATAKRLARSAPAPAKPADTFTTVLSDYNKRHLSKLRSGVEARRVMERHCSPKWGDRLLGEIKRRDVLDLLDDLTSEGKATTANRVRVLLSGLFGWAVGRDIIEASPITGTKPPAKEQSRDRVLSDDELRWLWEASGEVGQPWLQLVRLLILTGQRRGEVAKMHDDEIQGDMWRLPAPRTKNGRAHDVALSKPARAILDGLERIGPYVCTTTGTEPFSGFSKGRQAINTKMLAIAQKERGEAVVIPPWTLHDIRRTVATGMARAGIAVRVTEAVLNHVSGTAGGIVAVYQRHDYADEKRQALEAWARMVDGIVNGTPANVVKLEARA